MKVIRIENSYNTWSTHSMWAVIVSATAAKYDTFSADEVLNRSFGGMYLEWYLHNIGYWLTLPFIKNETIKELNNRFKDLDLEEHK